jgi:UTRA domain
MKPRGAGSASGASTAVRGAHHDVPQRPPVQILADRMAADLTRREPGYALPRRTALARRFRAAPADIDAAVDELVRRHLLRRLPTGQVHRAGPAEYLVSLDGLPGLSSFIDPMDHRISCTAVRVSRLPAAADIADVLGVAPGSAVWVRRCLWTADGEPAATRVIYVKERHGHLLTGLEPQPPAEPSPNGPDAPPGSPAPDAGGSGGSEELALVVDTAWIAVHLGAVRLEIQPPARSIARKLRLGSGVPAIVITARLDAGGSADPPPAALGGRAGRWPLATAAPGAVTAAHEPVALTVLALRPDMFRIVLDSADHAGRPPDSP